VCLGSIAAAHGFSIIKLIKYIKEELFLVLGTSSSESALPRLMAKMENAGAQKSVVGLVVPTGYSFNLDGTSIYLTMAAVFIAQATNTPMDLSAADHAAGHPAADLERVRPVSPVAVSSCWRPRCRRLARCRWPAWR
jgi:hypothetical protein